MIIRNRKEFNYFIDDNPDIGGEDHIINIIVEKFAGKLIELFGRPLTIILEVMPDEEWNPALVAWIQWHGDFEDGMDRYFRFEEWYVDEGLDLEFGYLHFSVEFIENKCVLTGQD